MIGVRRAWADLITEPWWFCNGWWSPWCVLDTLAHKLGLSFPVDDLENPAHADWWICRKHDAALERHLLKRFSGSPNPLF
jgi:hypothetical protein